MARGRLPIGSELPYTPAQYDLLSTATFLDLQDAHWQMGINWVPNCPEVSGALDACLALTADGEDGTEENPAELIAVDLDGNTVKSPTSGWAIRGATPFTVYARIDCSPVGTWDEISARTEQALTRAEATAVEQAFFSGILPDQTDETVYPHLASENYVVDGEDLMQIPAEVVSETPVTPQVGIGLLEHAMRQCYPGVATLHMPLSMAALMGNLDLSEVRAGTVRTRAGSKVVFGAGYPGTAPDGTDTPGVSWIYATGDVFYQRDAVRRFTPVESLDRTVNTVQMIAERTYVIGWDCCLMAVPVITDPAAFDPDENGGAA